MKNFTVFLLVVSLSLMFSCTENNKEQTVFSGRMDTEIITVSAKGAGTIDSLVIEEGQAVKKGMLVGKIDIRRLLVQKKQQGQRALSQQLAFHDVSEVVSGKEFTAG